MDSTLALRSRAAAAEEGASTEAPPIAIAASIAGVKRSPRAGDFEKVALGTAAVATGTGLATGAAAGGWATAGAETTGTDTCGVMFSIAMRSGAEASIGTAAGARRVCPSMAMMSAPSTGEAFAGVAAVGAPRPIMNAGTGRLSGAGEF